jgi:hypothetical protein
MQDLCTWAFLHDCVPIVKCKDEADRQKWYTFLHLYFCQTDSNEDHFWLGGSWSVIISAAATEKLRAGT